MLASLIVRESLRSVVINIVKRLAFAFLFLTPVFIVAQCCSGGVPMSNNIGLPSASVGTFQLNVNYDWNNLETLKSGDQDLNDNTRQRETHALLLEFGYSFTNALSLDIFIPFIRQERTINTFGTENFQRTNGLGDVVLLPKYTFNEQWTVGIGVKLPTGKADSFNNQGIALPADLQAGSGALDGILFLAFQQYSAKRPSLGYFGNLIFRSTGENDQYFAGNTYEFGNELQVAAGVSDRFLIGKVLLDPSFRAFYRKRGRDFFENGEFPGSGGDFVFLNPGISIPVGSNFSWQANVTLPIYSFVVDTQLAPTVQVNAGISFKKNLKSTNQF